MDPVKEAESLRDWIDFLPLSATDKAELVDRIIALVKAQGRQLTADAVEIMQSTWFEVFGRKS